MSTVKDKPIVLKVEVPGSGKPLNGAEGDEAAAELGLARVSNKLVKTMARLGVDIELAGIVHTDRGFAFATKEGLWECADALKGKINKTAKLEDLCEIATALGKIAKGISVLSGKNIGGEDAPKPPDKPRQSFIPGQTVEFHQHTHVHNEKP